MTNFNSRSAITFPDHSITMAHDVFISYSLKDKPIADAACVVLETSGIRCWIAPRDIVPGRDWGGSIMEAIRGCRAMVLIFSENANTSAQIKREVERAINKGIPVIPFRIEDVAPSDTLEYFISTPHWLDAFTPPLEPHLAYLAEVARQIVGGSNVSAAGVAERESREKAEAETATLAEEERKAAKLKLADEKKATEAAKEARLVEERRKAEQEARLQEEKRRSAVPLPTPPPIRALRGLRLQIEADRELTPAEQSALRLDLKQGLEDDDSREDALTLLRILRRRQDLRAVIAHEIDDMLKAYRTSRLRNEPTKPM